MGKHKKYTPEIKVKYAKEVAEKGRSLADAAKELKTGKETVRRWLNQYIEYGEGYFYQEHRGRISNPYAALHKKKNLSELEKLEFENLKLRIENERLKKGYTVKGVGATKEFVTFKDKNTK